MSQKAYNWGFKYYFNLYKTVLSKSFSNSLVYRFEFIIRVFRALFLIAVQVVLVKVVYQSSDSLGAWGVYDYYLLLGIYNTVYPLSWGLFNISFWRLEDKIIRGEYDFNLLYPSGSVFSTAFLNFFVDDVIGSVSGIIMFIYALINLDSFTYYSLVIGVIAIILGLIIWFALNLAIASFNFIVPKNGLLDLSKSLARLGTFPSDIYTQSVKLMIASIFPIAFMNIIPAEIIVGIKSPIFILYVLIFAMCFLWLALKIWRSSLESYVSAGG